jgi:F0F1-type ATP synthase assembly protein I
LFFNQYKDTEAQSSPASLTSAYKLITLVALIVITAYCMALVINKVFAVPLLLVALLLLCYLCAVIISLKTTVRQNIKSQAENS